MRRGRSKTQTVVNEAVDQAIPSIGQVNEGVDQAIPSTGQVNGRKRGRPKQVQENPTLGVGLNTETTEILDSPVSTLQKMLRSMVPIIVEETMRKIQEERRVTEEIQERSRELREKEVQEWKHRKKFLTARPREFHGVLDPFVVSNWIMEIENIFEICECSEDQKVLYASFMLRGSALHWWNTITEAHGKEIMRTMLWDQFKALVYKNFSPKTLIRGLEEEFINLKQGNSSVQRYLADFMMLSRFASLHVSTEERKITRFIEGLNAEIRSPLVLTNAKTFAEVVEIALIAENGSKRQKEGGRQAQFKKARIGGL